ncbi:alpha/beta fold hydrolase [Arthrobacter zhaoguopingii]|uniref:alpha/beta fold hydrolase n=1 Tax=Arthrobacter zhaoguopingii TaxID=2681491 RepID=UPI001359B74A|nr:alpha/beta hydrolase [Arthrobacter zhaoguopingii]
MNALLSPEWWDELGTVLNNDEVWRRHSKFFDGRVAFDFESGVASLEIREGRVAAVGRGNPVRPALFTITGPREEWLRVITGGTDWFEVTGAGQLAISGDAVAAMRNANTMWLAFEAMKRVGGQTAVAPVPSPSPPEGDVARIVGHYILVNGVRTYYEEAGVGPAILCLHAAAQDSLQYRYVLDALSDRYRVIAFDAPGHCKSLEPTDGLYTDTTQHAEFTEALIDALGLEAPVLIGCSFAGNEVLELAVRRPGHYSGVVSAQGADFTPRFPEFALDMFQTDGHQLLNGWARSLCGSRTPEDRLREVVWQIKRSPTEVMVADLTSYGTFDQRERMNQIDCPVLLIRGDEDWLVTQDQVEETQKRIVGSKIALLSGTGHYPMIENPVEFSSAVRTFLEGLDY